MSEEKFKVIDSKLAFRGTLYDVVSETLLLPNKREVVRSTVIHPGAVVILPQSAPDELVLIKQYRHSIRKTILEFPAGTLKVGQEPLACAKQELAEEVHCAALEWVPLGYLYPAPGICNEVQHCFFASGLSQSVGERDEDEIIEVVKMKVIEVEKAIATGELSDGKSIAVFARARALELV